MGGKRNYSAHSANTNAPPTPLILAEARTQAF